MSARNRVIPIRPKRKSSKVRSAWPQPTSISYVGVGMPDRFGTHLRYSSTVAFVGSPIPSAQVYRMNSLFDPDLTGAGSQPEFFDQFSAMYGTYGVLGGEVELEINNNSTTEPSYVVAMFCDQNVSTLALESLKEAKYSKHILVNNSPGPCVKTLRLPFMNTSQINGQRQVESDPSLYALTSANPTDQWFLIIKVASVDGITNVNVSVVTNIVYKCYFKELTTLLES